MAGGILQLVTKGIDDIFLTNDPQITLWKMVYRRYDNFCKIEKEQHFPNKLTFGGQSSMRFKRLADLINKVYLLIDLPRVSIYYYPLTYAKLFEILSVTGMRDSDFFTTYNSNDIVTTEIYKSQITPKIIQRIYQYMELIQSATTFKEILIKQINSKKVIISNSLEKYSNPDFITHQKNNVETTPILHPQLSEKYKLILNLLRIKSRLDPQYNNIYNVYQYLYNLYDQVDAEAIKLYSIYDVRSIIYSNTLSYVFLKPECYLTLIPGFQPEYIIGSILNPITVQPNYLSENYIIQNKINFNGQNIVIPPGLSSYPALAFFENLIFNSGVNNNVILKLNFYLALRKYISSLAQPNQLIISSNNIVNIQQNVLQIYYDMLVSNLSQFTTILNIINNFQTYNRFAADVEMLTYGLFYTYKNAKMSYDELSRNIFFSDQDYATLQKNNYYNNWVKRGVNTFFSELQSFFSSKKFISYYVDPTYWQYFNLIDSNSNSTHLSSILAGNNGIILEDINENINFGGIFRNVWLFEFTPFLVMKNLYDLFKYGQDGTGTFWNPIFSSSGKLDLYNLESYYDILLALYMDNTNSDPVTTMRNGSYNPYNLGPQLLNYIKIHASAMIGSNPNILVHLFTPYIIYKKQTILNGLVSRYPTYGIINLNYLGFIYTNLDEATASINDIPKILFPLDYLILSIGMDTLNLIDQTEFGVFVKVNMKLAVVKLLRLFMLQYNEIPEWSTAAISSSYYSVPISAAMYINKYPININTNEICRISSIWNYLCTTQMTTFNNLYRRQLVSTTYYRLFPSQYTTNADGTVVTSKTEIQGQGLELCIGLSLQQAFELYVSYFFNARILTPPYKVQFIPLEYIINNTSFYNTSINSTVDPTHNYMSDAISAIEKEIISLIGLVVTHASINQNLLEVETITLDANSYFYSTLYNTFDRGLQNVEYDILRNDDDIQTVVVQRVSYDSTYLDEYGFVPKIYDKFSISHHEALGIIIGGAHVQAGIVPMQPNMNYSCGETYISMYGPIPTKNPNNKKKTINRKYLVDFYKDFTSIANMAPVSTISTTSSAAPLFQSLSLSNLPNTSLPNDELEYASFVRTLQKERMVGWSGSGIMGVGNVGDVMDVGNGTIGLTQKRPSPSVLNNIDDPDVIIRGVLDMFAHIREVILINQGNESVVYYDYVLNLCGIRIAKGPEDFPSDITINIQDAPNSQGGSGTYGPPDNKYLQFLSPYNDPGRLITNTNLNPPGFTNADITKKYNGFSNIYNLIQFILDLIIYDFLKESPVFGGNINSDNLDHRERFNFNINDFDDLNSPTSLNNLETLLEYLDKTTENHRNYLSHLLIPGSDSYHGSEIDKRVIELLWDEPLTRKPAKFAWAKYIGFALIDWMDIKIGGQVIDKHTGLSMYLDYLETKNENHKRGDNMMLGNLKELYEYNTNCKLPLRLYVPLRFWFCKYFNESLPMICLRYTDVVLTVKLKEFSEVAYWNHPDTYFVIDELVETVNCVEEPGPYFNINITDEKPSLECYLLFDYIYLSSEERKRFANSKHEYLIDTITYNGSSEGTGMDIVDGQIHYDVYFHNMCKELLWVVRFNRVNGVDGVNGVNGVDGVNGIKGTLLEVNRMNRIINWNNFEFYRDPNAIKSFQINFDGIYREHVRRSRYFTLVQPYSREYSSFTKNVFLYSFALYPRYLQPSGAVNLDKLNYMSIIMRLSKETECLIKSGEYNYVWDVFGKTYNVLRVMSGMAGLAFYTP